VKALHRFQYCWMSLRRGDLRTAALDLLRGVRWTAVAIAKTLSIRGRRLMPAAAMPMLIYLQVLEALAFA
jgi:hypothetical protein